VLALRLSCLVAVVALGCGSAQRPLDAAAVAAGGPTSRIEQRSLADRPALAIIERAGDPEAALGFASLAAGSAETHAALGELLRQRLTRAGFQAQLVAHGLGFELTLLGPNPNGAGAALKALLYALSEPVAQSELGARPSKLAPERPPSAVGQCSAELSSRRAISDASELERERVATFARDRSALAVVGDSDAVSSVADVLAAGPAWPELGPVRSVLPTRNITQVLAGDRGMLSIAFTVADPNRAISAAGELGEASGALEVRLGALGSGLRLRRVTATAHPGGACLRVDSDIDASPLPDARRLGFAIQVIDEEAAQALARPVAGNRLDAMAVSATDPRVAARAAAYRALVEPESSLAPARLVALTAPNASLSVASIDAAAELARAAAPPIETQARVEEGQPGAWALVTLPCAAATERESSAGHAAVFVAAASANPIRGVRLEPWLGGSGVGIVGFAERAPGESNEDAAARLGDALGRALLAPPSALDVASARSELLKGVGETAHPLLENLLQALAPGHFGALVPKGDIGSLQAASREAVLARQRELLRAAPRLAVLSPGSSADAAFVTRSLSRWLKAPDAWRASPCSTEIGPAARSELSIVADPSASEGSYLAFRISPKLGAEASVLADLLNLPDGALARAMRDPELVGAARALPLGTSSARAFIVQVSAFEGREAEALLRIQKLFERLATGGVLTAAELESALAKRRSSLRLAALDPRYRLVQLLEPAPPAPDAAALRRFAALLRPESAIIARGLTRPAAPSAGKSPAAR
jgi:hypothetical protein